MSRDIIIFSIFIFVAGVCVSFLCVIALNTMWHNSQLNAKTISLKASDWKCTKTEHYKGWDGCSEYTKIGDN